MKAYRTMWWNTARHWAAISAFSPLVISERVLAAATSGAVPTAAHQAEMTRMVVEKGEAVAESATALWFVAVESQQLAWQRAWRAGRAAPLPADYALAASTARKLGQAWSPVSRRVAANAKRLAAKKRKTR
ncbi:MAG: hypothetical protein ACXWVT_12920 [Burkholderiaceae bacterium]